jgi:uncharacterized phage protein (TIGR02218 family)
MSLTGTELKLAELYMFTLKNGVVAYFTSHDANLVYGGHTYQAIPIQRGSISYHSDLQIDTVDINMGLIGILIGTAQYTIPQIIRREFLRQANVKIYLVNYTTLAQELLLFDGYISGDISYNAGILTLNCGSILDRLNDKFPRLIYTEFCQHNLFDSRCGLIKGSPWSMNASVAANSTTSVIYNASFAYVGFAAPGFWTKGEIKMTSGSNDDISRSIRSHGDGYIILLKQFDETITVGDTFTVYAGCDKTGTTCADKFSNYVNFFGFEYIPKPETMYG